MSALEDYGGATRRQEGSRMKLSELLTELTILREEHGDIEVCLQNDPQPRGEPPVSYESFFVVADLYEDRWQVNLRTWPY